MEKFLEKNNSVKSVNKEGSINVGLSVKQRLMANDNLAKTFSLYEQYNLERDNCNKFRLICEVNPICSNVLFNRKTEIVQNEGSDECMVILEGNDGLKLQEDCPTIQNTSDVTYMQAMRDTEYSHKDNGGWVYHCGLNIFNNHMLRSTNFTHINKMSENAKNTCSDKYNTIEDYLRDNEGNLVSEIVGYEVGSKKTDIHIYNRDTILSFKNTFKQKLKEKDGWWGFTNPGNMEIANNSGNTMINRMMANNRPCEFIDMYPDRSLFSFVPKYNKYRNRNEKNWDYCITYPYKSDYSIINYICSGQSQAIKCNCILTHNAAGTELIQCRSMFKHNLNIGDYISVYNYVEDNGGNKEFTKLSSKVVIMGVGDSNGENTDSIFLVRLSDIKKIYNENEPILYFKRIVNGTESNYYARIFKKVHPLKNDGTRDETKELKSDINKMAYGNNIYGDEMAQVVFTDDIDLTGLIDNNGRPVSKVYLTAIKRNAGHDLWYSSSPIFSSSTIEYSHCFGKVTSGFDFGLDSGQIDYNVRYLHNVNLLNGTKDLPKNNTKISLGETFTKYDIPLMVEDDITISGLTINKEYKKDEFLGDVVEFNSYDYSEKTIDTIYHRFNTAQREFIAIDSTIDKASQYSNIKYDEIVNDDYDKGFEIVTRSLNDEGKDSTKKRETPEFFGNIAPEGYFYKPHTEIKLREESYYEKVAVAKVINYATCELKHTDYGFNELTITFPTNYGFVKGEYIGFYNKETEETVWGEIYFISGNTMVLHTEYGSFRKPTERPSFDDVKYINPQEEERIFTAYWAKESVPCYAKYCKARKGYVWKELVSPSQMTRDMELYDMTYSNGRMYVNKNVNFFLKRQDPDGSYGLSKPINPERRNPINSFNIDGKEPMDLSSVKAFVNNLINLCQ